MKVITSTFPYELSIDLQVLKHLGIGLYSNIPAVISEVVANSYDADAENVWIDLDPTVNEIIIKDDGCGMTLEEINAKYLRVGYDKRNNEPAKTPKHKRLPMGRKGIGKLSLFSIATIIEVHSVKRNAKGEVTSKCGFIMDAVEIDKAIKGQDGGGKYYPTPVDPSSIMITQGTRIAVRNFHKGWRKTEDYIRRRVARRFSIIGSEYSFKVFVNDNELTLEDRDYFDSIEYIWGIGKESQRFLDASKKAKKKELLPGLIGGDSSKPVIGWIGTVFEHKDLGEDDNAISILMRGKVAHENVLTEIKEGRFFKEYLIGEIRADWLDIDDKPDLATSNRQSLQEDDPRFREIKDYVKTLLNLVANQWTDLRNENTLAETKKDFPKIDAWMDALPADHKKSARILIQKIGVIQTKTLDDKREIFRHAILAFETLAYKKNLEALQRFEDNSDFEKLKDIFSSINEVEESYYYQIVKGRVEVLKKFQDIAPKAKEKVVHQHILEHLWLLDPSWERASTDAHTEQSVMKEFGKIDAKLTTEEKAGRLDIRYRTAAGKHIIIELKKGDRQVSAYELAEQAGKYRRALQKCLTVIEPGHHHIIEVICLVGKAPNPPAEMDRVEKILEGESARFITYDNLIKQTRDSYREYLDAEKKISRIQEILDSI